MRRSAQPVPPTGLPVPLTGLIGRERQLADLCTLLESREVRIVTLIGPGGVGKTRLALAAAERCGGLFPHGVHFVALGPISAPDLVISKIAQDLRIHESGDQTLIDQLVESFRERRALIVLDGFERLVAAAPFLTEWLARCTELKCLVTSRRLLNVTGEHIYPVPPLEQPPVHATSVSEINAVESVQLFVVRARAAAAGFSLNEQNASTVAQICGKLEGLPLALELAAARVRHFPLPTLLEKLEEPLELLRGGPADAPRRQQSLAETIAWSYDLMSDDEARLLRLLSVFKGGFGPRAAGEICSAACLDPAQATDVLASLADHSLVSSLESPGLGMRYQMLDTIREFAFDRLAESDDEIAARECHLAWCQRLVDDSEASLGTARQREQLHELDVEYENVRGALRFCRHRNDSQSLGRLAAGMWRFWYARGYLTDGRFWLEEALKREADLLPDSRVKVTFGLGAVAHAQGDESVAAQYVFQALTLARETEDWPNLAMILHLLGVFFRDQGDYTRSLEYLEESLGIYRRLQDTWGTNLSLNALTSVYERSGQIDRATDALTESIELARAQGDQWALARGLSNMALIAEGRGDFQQAANCFEECIELYREVRDRRGEADALTGLGRIAESLGNLDRAIELHQQSLSTLRSFGDRRGAAKALVNLALAHLHHGASEPAVEAGRESLQLRHSLGDQEGIAASLEMLAEAALASGHAERAVRLWAGAAAIRDTIGAPLTSVERASYEAVVTEARSLVSPERLTSLWAEGRTADRDGIVAYALSSESNGPKTALSEKAETPAPHAQTLGLSKRELEVLRLLDEHSDREISEALFISRTTVSTHVTSILNKLGVNSRTSAVAFAIRHGLI